MIQPKSTDLCIGWYGPVDGRWMGLLDHFSSIEILDRQMATEWIEGASTDRKLLIGLEHRSDPRLRWVLDLASKATKNKIARSKRSVVVKSSKPKAAVKGNASEQPAKLDVWNKHRSMACVLGEDWAGHRRTFPLPESIETFYWHQWYDQVLPWVGMGPSSLDMSATGLRVGRIETDVDRFLLWRKSKQATAMLGNRIAWVVSDQDSTVELLQGALESYGIRAIGSRSYPLHGVFEADLVIIEASSRDGSEFVCSELHDEQKELLVQIRHRQPGAFMVVTEGFVQMSRWEDYRRLGVDAIVARPWSLQGLLFSWERWLNSRGI